ncbi:MAG TPA: hypothetical protein VIK86_09315 [Candidatus Paceibacterota bacterium]
MSNEKMTEDQARIYVSKYILPQIKNAGDEMVLRTLIFSMTQDLGWKDIGQMIINQNPQLTQDRINTELVSK